MGELGFAPRLTVLRNPGSRGTRLRAELHPLPDETVEDLYNRLAYRHGLTPTLLPSLGGTIHRVGIPDKNGAYHIWFERAGIIYRYYPAGDGRAIATEAFAELPARIEYAWTNGLYRKPLIEVAEGSKVIGRISLANLRSQAKYDRVGGASYLLRRAVVEQGLIFDVEANTR